MIGTGPFFNSFFENIFRLDQKITAPQPLSFGKIYALPSHNAHCILLSPNYTMTKTCLSSAASPFDESYASPSHNSKDYVFYPEVLKDKTKHFFSAALSLEFSTLDQCKNCGPVNWSPSGHQGLAAARATYERLHLKRSTS